MIQHFKKIIKRIIYLDAVFGVYETIAFVRWGKIIESAEKKDDLKLHLGSGSKTMDGWIDIDMRVAPDILTMRLPRGLRRFEDNSARYIYSSHFLEHLEYPAVALDFVGHCHRILKPGGTMRIVVPGIEKIIRAYVADNNNFFKIQSELHPAWCTTKLEHLMYALQQDGRHKYGYDFETMEKLLKQGGFRQVRHSGHNESREAVLRVDYRTRTDETGDPLSLYVEAVK